MQSFASIAFVPSITLRNELYAAALKFPVSLTSQPLVIGKQGKHKMMGPVETLGVYAIDVPHAPGYWVLKGLDM
jgi:hypothetical protein